MFEHSLDVGLNDSRADVHLIHVITKLWFTYPVWMCFDCGIMVSDSYDLYYDNCIRLVDCYGEKMLKEFLLLVEIYIDGKLYMDWRYPLPL